MDEESFQDQAFSVVAQGICKSFGQLQVLKDLDLKIPKGTTYCLLGPNGSGKTTFIRAVVGLVHPDGGVLSVLGQPVSRVQEIYPKIGYMTQHKALYPDLTLQENMEFFAGLYGIVGREREERISELLEMVALTEHRQRLAGALSGGMYQRLSLACTLIHEPELLLLDEPTVGIDPQLRLSFWEHFNSLAREGKTVLITTHLMDEAERCKIVGYMRGGRMQAEGSPEEIKRAAGLRPELRLRVEDPDSVAIGLETMGLDVKVVGEELELHLDNYSQMKEILDAALPLDFRLKEPSLEEAFLKLSEGGA